jgi:ribonucleotide monophosphatase NagD (HAD superfamily)
MEPLMQTILMDVDGVLVTGVHRMAPTSSPILKKTSAFL